MIIGVKLITKYRVSFVTIPYGQTRSLQVFRMRGSHIGYRMYSVSELQTRHKTKRKEFPARMKHVTVNNNLLLSSYRLISLNNIVAYFELQKFLVAYMNESSYKVGIKLKLQIIRSASIFRP